MDITQQQIKHAYDGQRCYVHARGLLLKDGFGLITMQKLALSGCDVFYGLEMRKTADGGKTYSAPIPCRHLDRQYEADGTSTALCDATPFYHKKTGKIILTGHMAQYGADNALLCHPPRRRLPVYAVYDEEQGDFLPHKTITLPKENGDRYFSAGAGCTQIAELEDGDLLIPIYFKDEKAASDPWHTCSSVAVLRCAFDGACMTLKEIGNELTVSVPRGLGEPSVIRFGNEYLLALRNDEDGYVAKSSDGLHYSAPQPLCFDNGRSVGNYNTQQHWLAGGGRLYLVYTRRAGNNDHVFRHRAPLFIAEFDPARMCVIQATERIAVPERGARLGNFGCQSYSDTHGYIFAAEWMQHDLGPQECARHGSDNSLFVAKITY
jgi:hypothetical protein